MYRSLFVSYGVAHFSKSLVGLSSVLVFAFFLTEIVGFSPMTMGIVMGTSLCFSALCDVGLGWALRHKIVSASASAPIMLLGSILTAMSFTGFAAAGLVPKDLQLPFVIVTLFAYRFSYTLFDLPHNAMMAFISSTDFSRVSLSAGRYFAAGIAKLIVAAFFGTWLTSGLGLDRAQIAFLGCLLFASIGVLGALALYQEVKQSPISHVQIIERSTEAGQVTVGSKGNVFRFVLLSIAIFSLLMSTFTKLQAYLVAYALDSGLSGVTFIVLVACGQIVSQFLWTHLASSRSLADLYQIAAVSLGIVAIAFLTFASQGNWVLLSIAFLYGGASSGLLMAIWSLQATVANQQPVLASQRFGLFIFVSKLAQASSILLLGVALDRFDFRDPENSQQLVTLMASGPIIAAFFCFLIGCTLARNARQSA